MRIPEDVSSTGAVEILTGTTAEILDGNSVVRRVSSLGEGASLLFEGRVRYWNGGKQVVRLRYQAYTEMADRVLATIAREAGRRFDVSGLGVFHRTGVLRPGETSVVIAVSAPHRGAAYEASRYIIESVKKRVPIWKKEEYADGSFAWLQGQLALGAETETRADELEVRNR